MMRSPPARPCRQPRACRLPAFARAVRAACWGLALLLVAAVQAQQFGLPSAPAGTVETGIPSFVVLGPEAVGLSSPPTDLQVLPDGRVLLVAAQELAIGDGVRWESFQRQTDSETADLDTVAVDANGTIYAGVSGGFARIEFTADAHWRFVRTAELPREVPILAGRLLNRVTDVAGEWYWNAGNGAIVSWRPGRTPGVLGTMNDLERVLVAGDGVFVSDPSSGATFRIADGQLQPLDDPSARKVGRTIVCSVPLANGSALVGTYSLGICRFDGRELRPLVSHGALAGRYRITDLCPTAGGLYCAALDNLGLVFFDETGRIVQMLDRSVDHRLGRVRRLHYASGIVWALLNEGVAQIEFPARLSHFESLITTGLTYAQLTRHEGELWLLAGGKAQRAIYDEDRRLVGFAIDTPEPFASAVHSAAGYLICATTDGLYWKSGDNWKLAFAGLKNANLCADPTNPRRWLLVAHDEVGWLEAGPDGPVIRRKPVPGLGSSYSRLLHAEGAFWAELGASRCARITVGSDGLPSVRVLTREDGLPDGWVQAFEIDNVIRFNLAGMTSRYDAATSRIVPDTSFLDFYRGLVGVHGRPARDALGRLWFATDRTVCVADDRTSGTASPPVSQEAMPLALRPIAFVTEDNGVVWMHQRQRLLRFDPAMPAAPAVPLRAIISHVQLAASNRHWVGPNTALPDLDYRDNSLVMHFLAPDRVFRHPVSFEVKLEGADQSWSPTGPAGVAAFNRLKEGRYVLHVRPRSGDDIGAETTLAFVILPPWFRTGVAYTVYALALLGLMLGGAALWSHIARRENERLERLVAERTGELRRSEDSFRRLNEDLERRVQGRTAELTASVRELESFSYSISHDLRAPLRNISGFADLLRNRLAGHPDSESQRFLGIIATESVRLGQLIDALLVFSRLGRSELRLRPLDLAELVELARRDFSSELVHRDVEFRVGPLPPVLGDPTLLRQVLANLVSNALKFTRDRRPAIIEIGTVPASKPTEHVFFVRDNGVGFDPKYSDKLFGVFQRLHHSREFEGTGIGLANVRRIIVRHGGRVWAEGRPGEGATFYFTLPDSTPPAPKSAA